MQAAIERFLCSVHDRGLTVRERVRVLPSNRLFFAAPDRSRTIGQPSKIYLQWRTEQKPISTYSNCRGMKLPSESMTPIEQRIELEERLRFEMLPTDLS